MSKLILFILISASSLQAFAQQPGFENRHIKDGRQYVLELARRLTDTQEYAERRELLRVFRDLRQNLPKDNRAVSLSTTLDSFAKVALQACAYQSGFLPGWNDVNGLYQTMLDRPATAAEIKNAVRDDQGELDYISNCLVVTLSPEFIYEK